MNNMKDFDCVILTTTRFMIRIYGQMSLFYWCLQICILGVCCPQKEPGITFQDLTLINLIPFVILGIVCIWTVKFFTCILFCIMYTSSTLNWEIYFSI